MIFAYDLVSRTIVSGGYGMAEWCIQFWVTLTLTLTSGLISRFFVSEAYLLYYS